MVGNKVSVIIPVYNAQKYVEMCIDSLKRQTYNAIECIFVDDGSKDNSREIILNQLKNDTRFRYIYQENSGPSAARNRGMQEATGKYLLFVDADDFISETCIEKLVEKIEDGYDLVCCGYNDISKYGCINWNDFLTHNYDRETLAKCVTQGTGGVLWGKIYKKELIQRYKLELDEDLFMSEDMIFVLKYIKNIDTWSIIDEPLYNYNRLNENSISTNINDNYLNNYEMFYVKQKQCLNDLKISEDKIKEYFENRVVETLTLLIERSVNRRELIKKVKSREFYYYYLNIGAEKRLTLRLALKDRVEILTLYVTLKKSIYQIGSMVKQILRKHGAIGIK